MDINKELFESVIKGHYEVIKYLIKKGANVNSKCNYDEYLYGTYESRTPISIACGLSIKNDNIAPNIEIIKLLLDNGADINILDKWGNTPLHYVLSYAHDDQIDIEIAKLLIDNGVNVNIKNLLNKLAVDFAPRKSRLIIEEYIAQKQQQKEFLVVEGELTIEKIIKWCNDNDYVIGKKI